MVDRNKGVQIMLYIILGILAILCILPFLLLVVSSFTEELSLARNGYSFLPKKFSFDAYKFLLVDSSNIVRGYLISAGVTVAGTLVNVCLTVLFAYPLSRRDLPGRNFFAFFIFFTMLFNGGLVPSYIMWTQSFGIKNTWFAYVVPNLMMSAFCIS